MSLLRTIVGRLKMGEILISTITAARTLCSTTMGTILLAIALPSSGLAARPPLGAYFVTTFAQTMRATRPMLPKAIFTFPRGMAAPLTELKFTTTHFIGILNDAPLFRTHNVLFSGSLPRIFMNNLVFAKARSFIDANRGITLDHNLYWTLAPFAAWQFDGTTYKNFNAYRTATHQDRHSLFADPLLVDPEYHQVGRPVHAFTLLPASPVRNAGINVCSGRERCSMGEGDFWGHPLPPSEHLDIGADQAP